MTQTRIKDLIPGLAAQIGIPEDDLTNILFFYYRETKRLASNLGANHITLNGLGTLRIKGWELEARIKKNEGIIASGRRADTQDLQEELSLLYPALERWKREKELKREMGIKKKQYYNNKNNNNETQGDISNSVEE